MRITTLTFGLIALCAGCSSSKPLETTATGGTGGTAAEVCTPPGYGTEVAPVSFEQVTATVLDPTGSAVPNLFLQICGINQCYPVSANANGKVSYVPGEALERAAFKYGDGFDFAELAAPLGTSPKQDLGQFVVLPLPSYAEGAAFPKHGPVTNGDLTLFVDSDKQVDPDELTYPDTSDQVFRSVSIPLAQSTRALPGSFGFELAFGVAPIGTVFCPAARLSVKNSLDWAPGTEVEVFVQGLAVEEEWAPYGSWVKVADASVSSDGSSIDTTSGGITILSSIALRRK